MNDSFVGRMIGGSAGDGDGGEVGFTCNRNSLIRMQLSWRVDAAGCDMMRASPKTGRGPSAKWTSPDGLRKAAGNGASAFSNSMRKRSSFEKTAVSSRFDRNRSRY